VHDDTLEKQAVAFFQGTKNLHDVTVQHVVPILEGMILKTPHENALIDSYYRMLLWLRSLAKLDYPDHFQTVLNAVRSLFELLVDLKLLAKDPTLSGKYHAFPFVTRFVAAKKYINHLDNDPTYSRPSRPDIRRTFITDAANQTKFNDLRRQHWGVNTNGDLITPDHWSNLDLASRTRILGPAELRRYRDIYSQCSWYVHSGSAGIAGVSPDGIVVAFNWGHGWTQTLFLEGTEVMCQTLQLFDANPNLRQHVDQASVTTAMFLDPNLMLLVDEHETKR